MAHQTQTITAAPSIQSFAGVGPVSGYDPRARIIFRSNDSVLAKNAGDTKTLNLTCDLPVNYAYVTDHILVSMVLNGSTGALDHYANLAVQSTSDGVNTAISNQIRSQGEFSTNGVTGEQKIYAPYDGHFHHVFFNQVGAQPSVTFQFTDTDAVNATAAFSLVSYVSFLQFDIQQAIDVGVNAPLPVRTT